MNYGDALKVWLETNRIKAGSSVEVYKADVSERELLSYTSTTLSILRHLVGKQLIVYSIYDDRIIVYSESGRHVAGIITLPYFVLRPYKKSYTKDELHTHNVLGYIHRQHFIKRFKDGIGDLATRFFKLFISI